MTGESPSLPAELLNRLLTGRELLKSFGSNLTAQTDALIVARAILAAQDASELVTSGIAEHVQAERNKKITGLMDYIASIEKKNQSRFPGKQFFENLNRARVSFKHHGLLPNSQEFHQVLLRTEEHLEQACFEYLGISLAGLDLSMLILNTDARALYNEALEFNQGGHFREALEKIAEALHAAVLATPLEFSIVPGESNSQIALELTAYGVDPGAFVRMQEFLPTQSVNGGWQWNTRDKGHPGNWKEHNVAFCLDTFVDIVRKIQYAEYQPSAIEFSFLFDDVLIAKRDGVLVYSQHQFPVFFGGSVSIDFFGEMKSGQRLRGKLTPAYWYPDSSEWEKTEFDLANSYVVASPTIEIDTEVPEYRVLIVRKEDVEWSFEPNKGAT
jgi:hypothetical protein